MFFHGTCLCAKVLKRAWHSDAIPVGSCWTLFLGGHCIQWSCSDGSYSWGTLNLHSYRTVVMIDSYPCSTPQRNPDDSQIRGPSSVGFPTLKTFGESIAAGHLLLAADCSASPYGLV